MSARAAESEGWVARVRAALSESAEAQRETAETCAPAIARAGRLSSVGLTGKGGGKLAAAVDVAVIVPSQVTARVQERHIAVIHALCDLVDQQLFPGAG